MSVIILSGQLFADVSLPQFLPQNDRELAETELYLQTVGRGPDLYMSGGHTMIRIVIPSRASDVSLNWGVFDFSEPNFAWKFFKGILIYRLGVYSTVRTLEVYQEYERRPLWQERINLTLLQKKQLIERFAINLRPENIRYHYDTFLNNCATIPRDHLDAVLSGNLRKIFRAKPISATFRDFSRYSLSDHIIENMFLDVVMNNQVDEPITVWEQAFLPKELRVALLMAPAFDDQGQMIPGSKLLTDGQMLISHPEPTPTPINGFFIPLASILLPTGVGFYFLSRQKRSGSAGSAPSRTARLFAAVSCIGFGFWAGIFGLVHTVAWIFSEHLVLKHNLNLALFWPTDLYFIWHGIQLFRTKVKHSSLISTIAPKTLLHRYCQAHIIFAGIWLLVALSGWTHQDVWPVMIYLLPVHILFMGFMITQDFAVSFSDKESPLPQSPQKN